MRAGGGNLTNAHIEDVSLGAVFLMTVGLTKSSATTAHSVRDANRHIDKMLQVLHEKGVTSLLDGPIVEDLTEKELGNLHYVSSHSLALFTLLLVCLAHHIR